MGMAANPSGASFDLADAKGGTSIPVACGFDSNATGLELEQKFSCVVNDRSWPGRNRTKSRNPYLTGVRPWFDSGSTHISTHIFVHGGGSILGVYPGARCQGFPQPLAAHSST